MEVEKPPGFLMKEEDDNFVVSTRRVRRATEEVDKDILRKKVWEVAKSPLGNIVSTLIMLYLSGDALSIMTIMLCVMMISGPVKSFMSFGRSFTYFDEHLKGDQVVLQAKVVYLLINTGILGIGLWKFWKIGILPFSEADLLRFAPAYSGGCQSATLSI